MTIEELQKQVVEFRDERDWQQFHNPKDLSLSLMLEATEVLEHWQWKNAEEMQAYLESHKGEIGEELADVLWYVLLLSNDLNIDLSQALQDKLIKNVQRYPTDKSKGKHSKYTELTK